MKPLFNPRTFDFRNNPEQSLIILAKKAQAAIAAHFALGINPYRVMEDMEVSMLDCGTYLFQDQKVGTTFIYREMYDLIITPEENPGVAEYAKDVAPELIATFLKEQDCLEVVLADLMQVATH